MTGTVKFFNEDKGFGFIKASDGKEYFAHASNCTDKITQDDKVTFELTAGKKGDMCINVEKA